MAETHAVRARPSAITIKNKRLALFGGWRSGVRLIMAGRETLTIAAAVFGINFTATGLSFSGRNNR